ncbi:MAG: hypothetical protein ACTSXN_11870 [Promethearchaeota archaeon]
MKFSRSKRRKEISDKNPVNIEDGVISIVLAKENSYHKLKGMITEVDRFDFYSACNTCSSKVDSNNWCNKCKAFKIDSKRFILSIILDDTTEAIKITFFGKEAVNLINLNNGEFELFSKMSALELADNEKFARKLVKLHGKKILVHVKITKNEFTNLLEGNANKVIVI